MENIIELQALLSPHMRSQEGMKIVLNCEEVAQAVRGHQFEKAVECLSINERMTVAVLIARILQRKDPAELEAFVKLYWDGAEVVVKIVQLLQKPTTMTLTGKGTQIRLWHERLHTSHMSHRYDHVNSGGKTVILSIYGDSKYLRDLVTRMQEAFGFNAYYAGSTSYYADCPPLEG